LRHILLPNKNFSLEIAVRKDQILQELEKQTTTALPPYKSYPGYQMNTSFVPTLAREKFRLKGRVQCFSMQVVINKWFLLNPKKKLAQIRLVIFEKNAPLILKNDVTEPKAR